MSALREEMQAQGMPPGFHLNLRVNLGELVTAVQIKETLQMAEDAPVTAQDEEMRELWASWLSFLRSAVEHGGIRIF